MNSKFTSNLDKIRTLMQDFFAEKIDALYVINNWPNPEELQSSEEGYIVHELHHYHTDEDIRTKEAKLDPTNTTYKDYQLNQIRELLAKLEARNGNIVK